MKLLAHFPVYQVLFIMAGSFLFSARSVSNQENYIFKYRDIAISESQRTGIPASIKLAQGLFESSAGRSELAINANNHFGIKCKNDWTGMTYLYKDDDLSPTGELIHSCFRQYNYPEDSYIDHSNFLTERSRYKELFKIDKTDYISWAVGLKNCGYATDNSYAKKIINTIEMYDLYELDGGQKMFNMTQPMNPAPVIITTTDTSVKSVKKLKKNRHRSRKH